MPNVTVDLGKDLEVHLTDLQNVLMRVAPEKRIYLVGMLVAQCMLAAGGKRERENTITGIGNFAREMVRQADVFAASVKQL